MENAQPNPTEESPNSHKMSKSPRTLYALVEEWSKQSWDGELYSRVAEELWDYLNEGGFMEGSLGATATLLETCVVDTNEEIERRTLSRNQAPQRLKELLEVQDFAEGAKIIEIQIKANPAYRITNLIREHRSGQSLPVPEWNRGKTLLVSLSLVTALVLCVVLVSLGVWEPTQIITWTIITGMSGFFFYYVRRRLDNFRFRRLFWIVGLGCFFSMPLILAWVYLLGLLAVPFVSWLATPSIPLVLRLVIFGPVYIIPPLLGGGLIAEKLGKRRDYMPYM